MKDERIDDQNKKEEVDERQGGGIGNAFRATTANPGG
jgi:hypothetical protein